MKRRTKIVCTLGPSTDDRETLRAIIAAGMDVARLNFSHGTHDEHRRRMEMVHEEARRAGRVIPILQDLQGPKIRVGNMEDGAVLLHEGQSFTLTSEPVEIGTTERATVSYEGLASDVNVGGTILMDDGNIELRIVDVNGLDVKTEVVVGGPLRSRKGVNLPHIRSSTPSLTNKDIKDLEFGLDHDVNLIALSFVRTGSDVQDLLSRIEASGKSVGVISNKDIKDLEFGLDHDVNLIALSFVR
ncbi:MAG: pyruvate kinase, partial [Bacteroidota bacterium]